MHCIVFYVYCCVPQRLNNHLRRHRGEAIWSCIRGDQWQHSKGKTFVPIMTNVFLGALCATDKCSNFSIWVTSDMHIQLGGSLLQPLVGNCYTEAHYEAMAMGNCGDYCHTSQTLELISREEPSIDSLVIQC